MDTITNSNWCLHFQNISQNVTTCTTLDDGPTSSWHKHANVMPQLNPIRPHVTISSAGQRTTNENWWWMDAMSDVDLTKSSRIAQLVRPHWLLIERLAFDYLNKNDVIYRTKTYRLPPREFIFNSHSRNSISALLKTDLNVLFFDLSNSKTRSSGLKWKLKFLLNKILNLTYR